MVDGRKVCETSEMTSRKKRGALKLYIWKNIRRDYTAGIGFALAESLEEARNEIKRISEPWEWDAYKGELMDDPEVYEVPTGFWMSGGG